MKLSRRTWLLWFLAVAIVVFVAVEYFTGYEVIGAAMRFVWNGLVFAINGLWRAGGEFVAVIARSVGMRRAAKVATAVAGVGLGYAGSVILSDDKIHRAHTWRDKLRLAITMARNGWLRLHLVWKLVIVAGLIASQVYLHFLLILFPIAFLVPVIRRAWIAVADTLFGSLYKTKMQRVNTAIRRTLWRTPGYPQAVASVRLVRMRYLCAWRRWRYDASYRTEKGERRVSFIEPVRLWWRGELDRYVDRPLLAGEAAPSGEARPRRPPAKARDVAPPIDAAAKRGRTTQASRVTPAQSTPGTDGEAEAGAGTEHRP